MPSGSFLNMSFVTELSGKSCLVIGAGVTGRAVHEALLSFGAISKIFDEKVTEKSDVINELPKGIELAIVSPGWKIDHPVILKLKSTGTEVIGEIDFAWKIKQVLAPNQKWIALTGTNGKTTTIKMVESIFKAAKVNGVACGNVGQTVIASVCSEQPFEYLAIELSSFQIQWSELPKYQSVALLNLSLIHISEPTRRS